MLKYHDVFLKGKTGVHSRGLKDYLDSLGKSKSDYQGGGFIETDLGEHFLRDILKLFSKSLLNCLASNKLLKGGYFSWGFTTAYYASYFSAQGINRFFGTAFHYIDNTVCQINYDVNNNSFSVRHCPGPGRGGVHQKEFDSLFDTISADMINIKSSFPHFSHTVFSIPAIRDYTRRNNWNYSLDDLYFFELQTNHILLKNEALIFATNHKKTTFIHNIMSYLRKSPTNQPPYHEIVEYYELSVDRCVFLYELLLMLKSKNQLFSISFDHHLSMIEHNIKKGSFGEDKDTNFNL